MAIDFRAVTHTPLDNFTASAPGASIIGVTGLKGSGKGALLRIAAGVEVPSSGNVTGPASRRLIRMGEPLDFSSTGLLALDAALSCHDPVVRETALIALDRLRDQGTTVLFASYDEPVLSRMCDEIWWLDAGRLAAKGHPREIFPKLNRFVTERLMQWGAAQTPALDLSNRRGDLRASIVALETLDAAGRPSLVLRSHAPASIQATVRFAQSVDDPVFGIMIRTRVGSEVYGTNTQLEGLRIGPCAAGQQVRLRFRFACNLCPGEYTLTAASHDPDGTPHDWLDDAVAFSVAGERYVAGVADLHATVAVE